MKKGLPFSKNVGETHEDTRQEEAAEGKYDNPEEEAGEMKSKASKKGLPFAKDHKTIGNACY